LFIVHSLQKMFGLVGGQQATLATMLGVAGLIETVAGTLIILGLYTAIAAVIASGEMAAAYFMAYAPKGALPVENGGELAARGDGMWSGGELLGTRKAFARRLSNFV
jgi:putative oxidoreductase